MNKVTADSIAIHSAQSDYYQYRTPYIPKLFKAICRDLNITRDAVLMDLGCGRGEVSNLLSAYAGKVYGVDGSPEMINLAKTKVNIEYQVVDLNSESPSVPLRVDHLFFGRSIHWFPAESLKRLSSDLLRNNGKIVVCSTQWSPVGEWGGGYFKIKEKFVPRAQEPGFDFTGKTNLGESGFYPIKRFAGEANLKVNTRFMIGHTFSTTYRDQLVALEKKASEFELEMTNYLKVFEGRDQILWKVTSWAIIYGKSQ